MIADSHAHLDMPQFEADQDAVVARAAAAGVGLIVAIGTARPGNPSIARTMELADKHAAVYAAIGVHPHDAQFVDEGFLEELIALVCRPKVVLWGEIGLDYHYDNSPREIQRRIFRRQLQIAREVGLPVSIHCRDAWEDLYRIVREEGTPGRLSGVLHSFSGTASDAVSFAGMGFLISFSGMITFRNAARIREAAQALRLDQVLVETDCPYLAPVPHRGVRNEPAFAIDVARGLAAAMGVSYDELASATQQNLQGLLGVGDN